MMSEQPAVTSAPLLSSSVPQLPQTSLRSAVDRKSNADARTITYYTAMSSVILIIVTIVILAGIGGVRGKGTDEQLFREQAADLMGVVFILAMVAVGLVIICNGLWVFNALSSYKEMAIRQKYTGQAF